MVELYKLIQSSPTPYKVLDLPFHGGNTGSNPVRVTTYAIGLVMRGKQIQLITFGTRVSGSRFLPVC